MLIIKLYASFIDKLTIPKDQFLAIKKECIDDQFELFPVSCPKNPTTTKDLDLQNLIKNIFLSQWAIQKHF